MLYIDASRVPMFFQIDMLRNNLVLGRLSYIAMLNISIITELTFVEAGVWRPEEVFLERNSSEITGG
jgi:hypothetical protein